MKKITLIPLIIIIVGVCLALAGFAAGGMNRYWAPAPAAPSAPSAPSAPNAPDAPGSLEAPDPPRPPGLLGWISGFWFDRGGIHFTSGNRGDLIKVDESFDGQGISDLEVYVDFMEKITFKEGDKFSVRGQNYESYGGLEVEKNGDKLRVNAKREGRWLRTGFDDLRRGWDSSDTWLEITYPKGAKLDFVTTEISAGRLNISDLDCKSLDVNNDFGDVDLNGISADDMTVILSAGNAKVRNVQADRLTLLNDFGKVTLEGATANMLTMNISSGDLSADNVSTRDLFIKNDFGNVRIDQLELAGRGEIDMSAGEVNISLNMSEDDLSYDLSASLGRVTVDGRSGGSMSNRSSGANASLSVTSDFGAITLRFLK